MVIFNFIYIIPDIHFKDWIQLDKSHKDFPKNLILINKKKIPSANIIF